MIVRVEAAFFKVNPCKRYSVSVDMITCPDCSKQNAIGSNYCSNCGAKLNRQCAHCGNHLSAGALFCTRCGASAKTALEHQPANWKQWNERPDTERKQVSILFADLCSSLQLLDPDPEQAKDLLEYVLDGMSSAVGQFGGTVSQAMGDGIMAIFGAPAAYEDHALRACLAAETMLENMRVFPAAKGMAITLRAGINSGEVVVSERGRGFDMQYTAFGQTAHLAARMEQRAEPGTIFIAESTFELVAANVTAQALGPQYIKGLKDKVAIYKVLSIDGTLNSRKRAETDLPFVTRKIELQILDDAFRDSADGTGRVIALVGEPGIGKSTLIDHFVATRSDTRQTILKASGLSHVKPAPFSAIIELVVRLLQIPDLKNENGLEEKLAAKLNDLSLSILPAIKALLGQNRDEAWLDQPATQRRQKIEQSVIDLLQARCKEEHLLIIIDDLQWIDDESLQILTKLAGAISGSKILLLTAYRQGFEEDWQGNTHYQQVPVRKLRINEAEVFLNHLLGADQEFIGLRQELLRRTNGNPFFIQELVRSLVADKTLSGTPGNYSLETSIDDLQVPATVHGVLAARIDRLPTKEKHILRHAAAIGQEVRLPILAALLQLDEDDIKEELHALERAAFLHPKQKNSERILVFNHELTHDVAYGTLLKKQRKALHRQIVGVVEAKFATETDPQVDFLAFHSERAEDWQRATTYFHQAGQVALARSACQQAVDSLGKSLTLSKKLPETDCPLKFGMDIRLDIRNALMPLGRHREILPYLLEAAEIGIKSRNDAQLTLTYSYLAHYYWLVGDWEQSIEYGELSLRSADNSDNFGLQIVTRFILGLAYYSIGDFARSIQYLDFNEDLRGRDQLKSRFGMFATPSVVSAGWISWGAAELGNFDTALKWAHESKELARLTGRPFDDIQGNLALGGVLLMRGEVKEAVRYLQDGVTMCERADVRILFPRVAAALGYACALEGNSDRAKELSERALQQADKMDLASMRSFCSRWICEVKLLACTPADALESARTMLGECEASGEKAHIAWAHYLVGAALVDGGDIADGLVSFEKAEKISTSLKMRPLEAHIWHRRSVLPDHTVYSKLKRTGKDISERMYCEMRMAHALKRQAGRGPKTYLNAGGS